MRGGVFRDEDFGSTAGSVLPARDRTRPLGLWVTELGFFAATAVMTPILLTMSQSPANLKMVPALVGELG